MSLSDDYLRYPNRLRGMDHDRYDWSIMARRDRIDWPDGAKIALWIVPALEWFPLDMPDKPFQAPGGLVRPYPDYWNYTLRDYGNRVGVFRLMQVLDHLGVKVSVAMNSALAERHPFLVDQVNKRGWEIIAHGVDMGHLHHGDLAKDEETELVRKSVETLRQASGQAVKGWLSPGKSESMNTPDLVAAQGIEYLCDWVNDDLPYAFRTASGTIYSMPHPYEIDDRLLLIGFRHSEQQFVEQVRDQFDCLYREADALGGRIMAISLHPWIIGQPYRIKSLQAALTYILGHDGVWSATGAEILEAFRSSPASRS
jgi:peptidoglycan/xylan/chitin deacetylase (PgdA/CDA1 family)